MFRLPITLLLLLYSSVRADLRQSPPVEYLGELPEEAACKVLDSEKCKAYLFNLNAKVHSIHFWQNQFDAIAQAPETLIEFLRVDNAMNGYCEQPVTAKPNPEFLALLKQARQEIPTVVNKVLSRKLVGIFLVENLGSTGYTLELTDENGPSGSSIIILDVTKLTQNANTWATWKDNSPFKKYSTFSIEVTIEDEKSNNLKNAIQYIVLHELGHVLERAGKHSPPKNETPSPTFLKLYPFLAQSWTVSTNVYTSRFDKLFSEARKIKFYADTDEDRLPISSAPEIYKKLESTNLSSLYALTNPWDDFAESFVGYVHTVLQKRPYQVVVKSPQHPTQIIRACWDLPRCREKRHYFDHIFRR